MTEYHNTTTRFIGYGARASCTARGCNWSETVRSPVLALAWFQAQQAGRRHTADEQSKALTKRREALRKGRR